MMLMIFIFFQIFFNSVISVTYYVSVNTGNDNWDGSQSNPFQTLDKANSLPLQGGDTVNVLAGEYFECIVIFASGNSVDGYISFVAEDGVTINGNGCSDTNYGILQIYTTSYVRLSGFKIINSLGYGILSACSDNVIIENNDISNIDASGIWIHGDTWCSEDDGNVGYKAQNSGFIVRNNTLNDVNMNYVQEGISVSFVNDFEIIGNKVYNTYKESLDVKFGCSNGIVAYNYLKNEYAWMGTEYNHPLLYVDSWTNFVRNVSFFRNEMHGRHTGLSVATEEGGTLEGINIYENIFNMSQEVAYSCVNYDVPGTHMKSNVRIYNNIIASIDGVAIWMGEHAANFQNYHLDRNLILSPERKTFASSFTPSNLNVNFFFKDNIVNYKRISWNEVNYEAYYADGSYVPVPLNSLMNNYQKSLRLSYRNNKVTY